MTTIDTRDLYKRKCELEDLRDALEEANGNLSDHRKEEPEEDEGGLEEWETELEEFEAAVASAEDDFGPDEKKELEELENVESEVSEFRHGETLIHVDDFEDYARDLAEDTGAIPDGAGWPLNCIDWEQAAKELAHDYSEIEFEGASYYFRG